MLHSTIDLGVYLSLQDFARLVLVQTHVFDPLGRSVCQHRGRRTLTSTPLKMARGWKRRPGWGRPVLEYHSERCETVHTVNRVL